MPKEFRTQSCTSAQARTRLAQADKFLEVAELVASETQIEESASVAASLAVLAGIAAADAACCHVLGRRSRSQDHHDAEYLVEQIVKGGDEAAKTLRRLLGAKDAAQYGLINISSAGLTAALRQAKSLADFAREALRG